ncbi:diguanylate cyclase [Actinoplanes sp. NEAU-A12]|uniref:Diguanylate cyclase n=1 Tax=Actinoplanes sandaracinus TaxID=3045177 RepID=A0ABT6X0C6_9ACTN|nr:tetratricopeptide repeat-containing diguanylate cyclase [Actinoplanes sandaracinus]MDI6105452.1 diguanylate cyclase [Actinoplanes sandaracinus]
MVTTGEQGQPFPAAVPDRPVAAELEARLLALELNSAQDFRADLQKAVDLERAAERLGRRDLQLRARMVQADVLIREGDTGEAGRISHQMYAEAVQLGDPYVLARSHRALSIFFYQVGDVANTLAHAVHCMSFTGDDVPMAIRARHLSSLGVILDVSGSSAEAVRRFEEALAITTALGDGKQTLQILNNMTYTAYEQNDPERAAALVERMRQVARSSGVPLSATCLDTVARVAMLSGRHAEAESVLAPLVDGTLAHLVDEGHILVEAMVTTAEAQREQRAYDRAQATLEQATDLCEQRDLTGLRVQVRKARALLYAATGRYREAFEEHQRFHDESEALQCVQRDVRARTLQAVYEAEEARRTGEIFRQMAYRDALTGLHNRRHVDEQLPTLLAGTMVEPMSIALIDIDHFKRINDTLSHQVGDLVLQELAAVLQRSAPAGATVARLGGEEFVILLPGHDSVDGVRACEAVRQAIRDHDWRPVTGGLRVTASIGVTTVNCDDVSASAALAAADHNLYAAKHAGRDQVCAGAPVVVAAGREH